MRRPALGAWLAVTAIACAPAVRPPAAPADDPSREGRTTARVLVPPPSASGGEVAAAVLTPAYASTDNALPVFPRYALDAGCPGGIVRIRLFLDAEGNPSGSEDLPGLTPAGRCPSALSGAVHAAVSRWRFAPAFRLVPEPLPPFPDGQPRPPRWTQTPVPIYLDYEFTFTVVEGRASVTVR